MHTKTLASGILLLLVVSIVSPLSMGWIVSQDESMILSDVEYTSIPYTSDSTISQTVILYQYLNPQPTMMLDNGLMDSAWPMKCHDLHHTSRSPYNSDDGDGLEKWRFKTDSNYESSAVIDNDGIIYFGSWDRNVYALYPDGSLKWKYKTGGLISSAPALAADGTVYVSSYDDKLHALNSNGTRKWTIGLGGASSSSPTIAPDGTIYVGTMRDWDKGDIVAINPNGTLKWTYETGYYIASDPAVGNDGTIYSGSGDNYLYALNPNGTLKWRFKTGDWVKAHPAIAQDGTVYISSFDGWLYALNPSIGSLIWKYSGGGDEASPAIGPDGVIYLGNNRLRALYPNGTEKWVVDVGPNIDHASPCLSTDGILYVGAGNYIVAVDSTDGSVLWQKKIANDGVYSSPIIGSDGTVYIGSSNDKRVSIDGFVPSGYFHAFRPQEGNSPPETPIIGGKPQGDAGEDHLLTFTTTDSDKNPVSFYVDWGDGSFENWTMEAASQETVYLLHIWDEQGDYTVRCKARDSLGEESDWGVLEIRIPYSYSYQPGWQWLQHHFPVITRLLTMLLPYQV